MRLFVVFLLLVGQAFAFTLPHKVDEPFGGLLQTLVENPLPFVSVALWWSYSKKGRIRWPPTFFSIVSTISKLFLDYSALREAFKKKIRDYLGFFWWFCEQISYFFWVILGWFKGIFLWFWVLGIGKTPPPCWEKFPNNPVFFFWTLPHTSLKCGIRG